MSTRSALALLALFSLPGCAFLLASSGEHSDVVKPGVACERVLAELGPPATTCMRDIGAECWDEIYRVHGKYPNSERSSTCQLYAADAYTLFVTEVLFTPIELGRGAYKSLSDGGLVIRYCDFGDTASPVVSQYETFTVGDTDALAARCVRERDKTLFQLVH